MIKDSWDPYVLLALHKIQKQMNTKEFGKLVQHGNEYLQRDWIESNTNIEFDERCDDDHNEAGYDHITINGLKIQSKFRSSSLHLENTRRHSVKNKGAASKTGHTAYSVGEADVYVFTIPKNKKDKAALLNSPEGMEILAIPEYALIDPNNPGFLRTRVHAPVVKKFKGLSIQTLQDLDSIKSQMNHEVPQ